ncbi:TRAP transporter, 4TM/12TM fusion protein (plasmid) [Ruegeria pomeroyi DSS-3]|uniref:TRAP transporter, 4TM/12TM fusion protein n=2 Tax=Ruegeria pomeroyi TaxID=89184 RepID=Q5LL60_RUEPO|nr:TRAP transporter fused permease subunit [Ruegeria pomeroyi]AAV97303.1 TRAP transporter, 4TM/12TM fusion protein [Ruegeria pomeroyi DSS-3]NVK96775.1 TRAP transporter fused permease subunit [Ruegeria pomeroyi]NVK99992.1 TRAP transporter fused permease subunit [Ruegeria pomeroyi]
MTDATSQKTDTLTAEELAAIEEKYDESAATRPVSPGFARFLKVVALSFATYHYLTAGFALPTDHWHMGWHLSGLFILTYALFPAIRTRGTYDLKTGLMHYGGVPYLDILLMGLGVASALYLGFAWRGVPWLGIEEQTFRMGNPNGYDMLFGSILIVLVLDIARRTLGWVLPAIICVFMAYALFGPVFPGILQHPGVKIRTFVSSMYFPQEGIFGVTLWVVSTIVFHFVLFGVIAQRTGLGQLFIDNATILAGRYTGGPAKVSVVSSAFFGTISGSSVANTVSTGALTIPNMKRLGYPGHFAGGVEAAASAGGQITPPIMGAAAFIMAEFLEVPYTTIVIAAIFPALLHYVGVFSVVHLMARRLNLQGLSKEMLPRLGAVWREGWANMVPLVGLLVVLFSGYTPYMSAFCGISLAIVTGMARRSAPVTLAYPAAFIAFVVWKCTGGGFDLPMSALLVALTLLGSLNPQERIRLPQMAETFETGVKYALAVGAAAAAVGIVVGVINTTGVGFRVGFMVTQSAGELGASLHSLLSFGRFELFSVTDITLFISLIFIAVACILMGAGIPTTALYIMLVSVAQPALAQLGVPPIASHMFVLYYGVVAEITPPVCTSAYAAAAIANSNPFRTGISAFTLGLGKIVAPMAFVYAPVLLIVSQTGFDLWTFSYTATSCILGVICLSVAVVGYWLAPMGALFRVLLAMAGLVFIAPSLQADLIAALIAAPAVLSQIVLRRRTTEAG